MSGCGCKICKAGLGELTNELIIAGNSPIKVLQILENKGLKTDKKLLQKHLSAFDIAYPSEEWNSLEIDSKPVTIDLNQISFDEYDFDINEPISVISYLQKLNLKVYLNQLRITLEVQQDVINGVSPNVPTEVLKNLAVAFGILDKSTAMSLRINQSEAIKIVEQLGFEINGKNYLKHVDN